MQYFDRTRGRMHRGAVTDDRGRWSYDELQSQVELVARRLRASPGWQVGTRVGLFLPRRRESAAVLLGTFAAGGIAVPFSVRAAPREIAYQIQDAGMEHLVVDDDFRELAKRAVEMAQPVGLAVRLHCIETLMEPAAVPGMASGPLDAAAAALIVYTSGTTGQPKGVVHTNGSLMAQVASLHSAWEWSSDDRLLHCLPLHHVHGLVNGLLGALWAGAEIRFIDQVEPARVWDEFGARRATVFYAVPTIYHQLTEAWERQDEATRRVWTGGAGQLRLMVSGSAALPARQWNRWREITGQPLLERYGMTEIGMALSNPYRGERRPGTVGQPLPGMIVRIATESGEEAAEGVPGEIWVQGPSLFREYWNKPDATRASFRDGFFLTGDIAEWRDGYVRIGGRASVDILKSAGYKLSALEIEEVLREHPAVHEVAVVGVPDSRWGEVVTACVVCRPDCDLSLDEVQRWCSDKLAPYKLPRRLDLRTELPRNALGKVTKPDLIRELTPTR